MISMDNPTALKHEARRVSRCAEKVLGVGCWVPDPETVLGVGCWVSTESSHERLSLSSEPTPNT
jgi:hypothetical protein